MPRAVGFIGRHAVASFYLLTFAISWLAVLLVVGPASFLGTADTIRTAGPALYAGPPIAALALTALLEGKPGLRRLAARLGRWRVGGRWYAVALLTAPLVNVAVLWVLCLASAAFVPAIVTSQDKLGLLLIGVTVGLIGPLLEELGWTGFALPRLRRRHGTLATGVTMGLLWGLWHLPLFAGTIDQAGVVPAVVMVAALLFTWLPPYRVLMVWVYDRTESVLVAVLMHTPIVAAQFVLATDLHAGTDVLALMLALGAAFWVIALLALRLARDPGCRTPSAAGPVAAPDDTRCRPARSAS